mgnify:CR=1 FL=1
MREPVINMYMVRNAHGRNLRNGRFSSENQIYLVTTVTDRRIPVFSCLKNGRILVREMMRSDNDGQTDTLAFVVMPDHIHWLFALCNTKSLAAVVGSVKRHSARQINRQSGLCATSVWQRGYHDHALRTDEDIIQVARYIVANPLRARLARRVGDYSLWDAVWL